MTIHTTILIVDDDPLVLMVTVQVVQRAVEPSVLILTAQNGEEGLHKALESKPSLIITDLMMPRMDGYDMVQSFRQQETCSRARIIGMSSASAIDPRTKEFRQLCDSFVGKPFKPNDVVAALNGLNSR
jgi:two-component system alkaline phosphatase synthesis response regulator PhoP